MTAMHEPKRIQLRRTKGWRKPEGAVVAARPSRWGNPFRVHGGTVYGPNWTIARNTWGRLSMPTLDRNSRVPAEWSLYISSSHHELAVLEAVELFHRLLAVRLREEHHKLDMWLAPLRGRDLCCWCPLDSPCHADVLLELANS